MRPTSVRVVLINIVAALNLLPGVACLAWGAYALIAGADVVAGLANVKSAVDPHLTDPQAKQATDLASNSLAAIFLALASVVAGCAIAQGAILSGQYRYASDLAKERGHSEVVVLIERFRSTK